MMESNVFSSFSFKARTQTHARSVESVVGCVEIEATQCAEKDIEDLKKCSSPPPNWPEVIQLIRSMRAGQDAPVDQMGTHQLADGTADKKTQQFQLLVAAVISSQTRDSVTAAAMTRLHALPGGLTVDEENKIEDEGDMSQATQQVLPTIDEETPLHKGDAMSTQEVVEHESDFVAQKPSNDMNKGSENMLPTIGETQIHEGNTRNSEEKMVVVENQSDVQTSPKPSDDMIIKDTYSMPLRNEEVEGSEKKDEANEEHQGALATTEVQDKVDKGTEKATRNANKAESI
ncbi:hypothetical protein L7F22_059584 [Adiantum nelumboides]|nr:hypothetical protein [Adiantum nelumboides]